ncbi:MAG: POTRA domain-containing protein, partial [Bdellovibrionota bacterium]
GEPLERLKVVRSAENLVNLYHQRGYFEASIQSRIVRKREDKKLETILEFIVNEGRPTRIAEVRFIPDSVRSEASRRFWDELTSSMGSKVNIKPGDIYDQDHVREGQRKLQDLLASEKFLGSRVSDVKTVESAAPANSDALKASGATARWVTLEFHVDLGDRVSFGFRGNDVLGANELIDLIAKLRSGGLANDYIAAIRNAIEERYHALGYYFAHAQPFTYEQGDGKHVTYVITEGHRVGIESVDFDGNSIFRNEELRDHFFERAPELVKNSIYSEKDVQAAADLVIEWMKSKGYLAAKLVTINTVFPPQKRAKDNGRKVRLIIYLYEGEQTLVRNLRMSGVKVFAPEEVQKMLGVSEGAPLNLVEFAPALQSFKAAYREQGFLSMKILNEGTDHLVRYADENRTADIALEVEEGPQYRVSKILIEGLQNTKEVVAREELRMKVGEILRESQILESEARLKRLQIFSAVGVILADDPEMPGYKIVRVTLGEGDRFVISGGPGFRNDIGLRAFVQFDVTNLWGLNHRASLSAAVNRRIENYQFIEWNTQLQYTAPFLFGVEGLAFRPSIDLANTQYISFSAQTYSGDLTLEKKGLFTKHLGAQLTYSIARVFQACNPGVTTCAKSDNGGLLIGSIAPALSLDFRDDPLAPTRGFFATSSFEFAGSFAPFFSGFDQNPFVGVTDPTHYPMGFYRWQLRTDYTWALPHDIAWYFSFRTGFEHNDEPSSQIPLIKQFALGGPGSLRGYADQELNIQDRFLQGTASYVNYRTQVDFPFAGGLKIGPFIDAANLLVDNVSPFLYFTGSILFTAGFGFHYRTPVGPVNLDMGFRLNPPAPVYPVITSTDTFRIDFSIGVI